MGMQRATRFLGGGGGGEEVFREGGGAGNKEEEDGTEGGRRGRGGGGGGKGREGVAGLGAAVQRADGGRDVGEERGGGGGWVVVEEMGRRSQQRGPASEHPGAWGWAVRSGSAMTVDKWSLATFSPPLGSRTR